MVLLFTFVAFEFWVLHHHGPTQDGLHRHGDYTSPRLPGAFPVEGGDEHISSAALPDEPSVPDSMKGGSVAGTEAAGQQHQKQRGTAPQAKDDAAVSFTLPARPLLEEEKTGELSELRVSSEEDDGYGDMRVAVLVPYSGPGLPLWFDAFTDLAAANKDLVDWIIFCAEVCRKLKPAYSLDGAFSTNLLVSCGERWRHRDGG